MDYIPQSTLVIIPAYQEQNKIGKVIRQILQLDLPVLVVNDGSTDNTSSVARSYNVALLEHYENLGKGEALKTGFRYALKHDYDYAITIDADGQHDPSEIKYFLDGKEHDLIIGYRDFSQMPLLRSIGNYIGNILITLILNENILDNQSGFRLISNRLMRDAIELDESGYEFEVSIISTCLNNNYSLKWIPIKTIYRDEESHINPLNHVCNYLSLMRTISSQKSIK